jgi:predicted ATPase/transcriptional regulator with XRE-family HTH domain
MGQTNGSSDNPRSPLRIGEWVRHARKAARLTQEELAERAGVSVYTISNLERGIPHTPRPDTLRLLARALEATPAEEAWLLQAARSAPGSSMPSSQGPLASPLPHLTALPLPLTPLLGREDEIEAITTRLQSPQVRLLSLLGIGGVGKTRLALECAHRLAQTPGAFADGIVYVSLAAVTVAGLVPTAIAEALGVRETSDHPLEEALLDATANRKLLLVLDNCEHLNGVERYLTQLLMVAPGFTALVTSREALNVAGEYRFEVRPLTLAADSDHFPLEQLAALPAVALLVERTQAVSTSFALTANNASAITEICRRLDGLPLALELAAPQLALLSPDELLERLDHRLSALSIGGSDRPARQQTLRATLDWSYDLLEPEARAGLRWLSACVGGSELETAEALCAQARQGVGSSHGSISSLEVITRLANHHLLQRQPGESGEANRRLTMLATIGEYASERLHESATEALAAQEAHAQIYLTMAETAAAGLQGPEQSRWLRSFQQELENVRAALRWSLRRQEGRIALRFVAALWMYWNTVGMLSEGRDWLDQALTLAPPAESLDTAGQRTLAEAYNGAGVLATRQGDFAAAERFHAQALPLRRALGDPVALASSLNGLGGLLMQQGRLGEAQVAWEESLHYRRQSGRTRAIALGLMNLGVLALNRGEVRQAVAYVEESVPLFRAAGDESMLANALINLAMASLLAGEWAVAQQHVTAGLEIAHTHKLRRVIGLGLIVQSELAHVHGDLDDAEAVAQEGLTVWREVGGQTNVAAMLALLGTLRYERGDLATSEALLQESRSISERLDDAFNLGDIWTRLGHLARLGGKWDEAVAAYQRSLRIHIRIESAAGAPEALEGLAGIWWEQGESARALDAYALAQALRSRTGAARAPYNEGWVAPLLDMLRDEACSLRWESVNAEFAPLTTAQLQAMIAELIPAPGQE